jgi:translin
VGGIPRSSHRQPLNKRVDPLALDELSAPIRRDLDAKFAAREVGYVKSREVIRASANAIRSLHRGQWESAEELVAKAGSTLQEVQSVLGDHPDILYAGFVHDAAKEYAEAAVCTALFRGASLPSPSLLDVHPVAFLHGLGEAVGELRRRMLDLLRDGELAAAEQTLIEMDQIVDLLADLDYPDGMTAGLRRTTDVSRALVERSRADLTTTVVQERLRAELQEKARDQP